MEDGTRREAACIGGMLSVIDGKCSLLATTWEWKEDIDKARADAAKTRAEAVLERTGLTDQEYKNAKAKLQRPWCGSASGSNKEIRGISGSNKYRF